jgi:hypothetical protein
LEPISIGPPLPTTDALFAENVEQKISNPLAHLPTARSFVDRLTKLVRDRELRISRVGSSPTRLPNLINPFWMLPLLGVLGLKPRHYRLHLPAIRRARARRAVSAVLFAGTLIYVPPVIPP